MYYVYILASRPNGTLYTGITNDLRRRMWEHKTKSTPGFTQKYGVARLVYFEQFRDVRPAIDRKKQIKAGSRRRKLDLIEHENPNGTDLSRGWFEGA